MINSRLLNSWLRVSILLSALCMAAPATAQDGAIIADSPAPSSMFTTIPVRCILNDWNIGYAKRLGEQYTLETRVGWVHRNNFLDEYYVGMLTSTSMKFHGPSVYFQLNKWHSGKKERNWFYGIIAGYRYLWYHDKSVWMGGMGGSSFAENLELSQWRNDVLLLGTIGIRTTRISSTEISLGARMSFTHTHDIDTRFHPVNMSPEEYEAYKDGAFAALPGAEGVSFTAVVRISSRFGRFKD